MNAAVKKFVEQNDKHPVISGSVYPLNASPEDESISYLEYLLYNTVFTTIPDLINEAQLHNTTSSFELNDSFFESPIYVEYTN